MYKIIEEDLTNKFVKNINDSIILEFITKHANPKKYYNQKIKIIEDEIQHLTAVNNEFLKIPKDERLHESINGDRHLITYQESIEQNKRIIKNLKIELNKYKQQLKKLIKNG